MFRPNENCLLSMTALGLAGSLALMPSGSVAQTTGASGEVWVGSPFSTTLHPPGRCTSDKGNACPLPANHWIAYGGDWSMDMPKPAYADVRLYLAPQHSRDTVSAKVASVREACTSGRAGGKVVRVDVFVNTKKVGTLAYSHLDTSLKKDDQINRWGGKIGTLFKTNNPHELCWTGPHLHFESSSDTGYSCYNKGIKANATFNDSNFIGFVTGNRAKKQRSPCP